MFLKLDKRKIAYSVALRRACIYLLVTLIGCAGTQVKITKPPSTKLSGYKSVLVEFSTQVPDSTEELGQIEILVISKLKQEGVFEKVLSSQGKQNAKTDLTLNAELIKLEKISPEARFYGGIFVGRAKAYVSVKLVDNVSGTIVSEFESQGQTGSNGFAGTTRQALELTSKQIVDYLKKSL